MPSPPLRHPPQADLNAPDSRGLRPIHLAAMGGMSESVAALLDAGVPVNAMGAEGNTALHLASWYKEEGVVAVLMRAGETFRFFFFAVDKLLWLLTSGTVLEMPPPGDPQLFLHAFAVAVWTGLTTRSMGNAAMIVNLVSKQPSQVKHVDEQRASCLQETESRVIVMKNPSGCCSRRVHWVSATGGAHQIVDFLRSLARHIRARSLAKYFVVSRAVCAPLWLSVRVCFFCGAARRPSSLLSHGSRWWSPPTRACVLGRQKRIR